LRRVGARRQRNGSADAGRSHHSSDEFTAPGATIKIAEVVDFEPVKASGHGNTRWRSVRQEQNSTAEQNGKLEGENC
jgi:hypothetical protein